MFICNTLGFRFGPMEVLLDPSQTWSPSIFNERGSLARTVERRKWLPASCCFNEAQ